MTRQKEALRAAPLLSPNLYLTLARASGSLGRGQAHVRIPRASAASR